jgi:hypothetical protein
MLLDNKKNSNTITREFKPLNKKVESEIVQLLHPLKYIINSLSSFYSHLLESDNNNNNNNIKKIEKAIYSMPLKYWYRYKSSFCRRTRNNEDCFFLLSLE